LDIGCGSGVVLQWLLSQGYRDIQGIDIDPVAINRVNAEVGPYGQLVQSDLRSYMEAQPPGEVGCAIARDVIYYLPPADLLSTLQGIRRALTPNGTFIAEIFNGAAFTGPYVMYKDLGIRQIFTDRSLQLSLELAGFKEVRVFPVRIPVRTVRQLTFSAAQRLWEATLRTIYLIERGRDSENPTTFSKKVLAVGRA
jgi:predicted TPR repeat methyltransferase